MSNASEYDGITALNSTASVIEGLMEQGMDKIVENKYAFVNFNEELIHSKGLEVIDSKHLIIEILENVRVDEVLIQRIGSLKKLGYKVALDDFVEDYETYPLVELADIIKFDLIATPLETQLLCENIGVDANILYRIYIIAIERAQEVFLQIY